MWDTRYFLLARAAAVHYSGAQRSQMILVSVPQTQREPHLWQLAELILVASATVRILLSRTVSMGKQPGLDPGDPVSRYVL